ncbi:outer membrane beta-barrel protein [Edaphocola aurantiacus]|uniref:outer membrane beta-barrel protein n=1 Tax=Edaphocola aurantiacus TaxID=2601682 RepID=UPI001C94C9AF|nr:outer membrane beta-barrel protein [Edaphocola aurantiacus]
MKIIVFVALCAIPFVNHAQQNNWSKGLSIEISGFQASAKRNDEVMDAKARPGFGAAILKRFPVCQKWAIETGIGFTQFNTQFTFYRPVGEPGTEIVFWHVNSSLNYLKIPLFATYSRGLSSKSALNFSAGINTRILITAKETEYGNFMWNDLLYYRYYNSMPIISPQVAIGYNYALKNNSGIRLEAFVGRDINRFNSKHWKYYTEPGRLYYYGLNVRYTFGRSIRSTQVK